MRRRDLNDCMMEDIAICAAMGRADDLFLSTSELIAMMKNAGFADDRMQSVLGWRPDFKDCVRRVDGTGAT